MPQIPVSDYITILDDFFAEWAPSLDGEPEAYESLKTAVLAQQANNMPSMPVCPHASVKWSVCDCRIKSEVNSKMSECDGNGNYTVIGNMGYRYGYQCNKGPGKPA